VPARVGLSSDGSAVTVARGDTLELSLPQNASTGYRWELTPSEGLRIIDDRLESPASAHAGAGGHRVFVLRVEEPGIVQARLRRAWEPPERAAQTYTLRVLTGPETGTGPTTTGTT
jgi:inhibitor of cysteine peptidase